MLDIRLLPMRRALHVAALAAMLAACSEREPSGANAAADELGATRNGPESAAVPTSRPARPAAAAAKADAPERRANTLTLAGLGEIVIGAPPPASLREEATQISDECRTLHGPAYPSVYAMSDGKRVRRITVMRGSPATTDRGIGPGASEADVRAAYPNLIEAPHEYSGPPAKNLTFRPEGAKLGLRFEIDSDRRAILIHAGAEPWLAYSEGCA